MVEKTAHLGLRHLDPELAALDIDGLQRRYLNKR